MRTATGTCCRPTTSQLVIIAGIRVCHHVGECLGCGDQAETTARVLRVFFKIWPKSLNFAVRNMKYVRTNV